MKRCGSPYEKANAEAEHVQRLGGFKRVSEEYSEEYDALSELEDAIYPFLKMDLSNPPTDVAGQLKRISKCLVQMWFTRY